MNVQQLNAVLEFSIPEHLTCYTERGSITDNDTVISEHNPFPKELFNIISRMQHFSDRQSGRSIKPVSG